MKKVLAAVVLLAGLAFIACQKEYSYETDQNLTSTGAWEFKDSANVLYTGNPVDYNVEDTSMPGTAHMSFYGSTANSSASLSIEVFFPTAIAQPGTYTSTAGQVDFLYSSIGGKQFKAEAFSNGIERMTVVLSQVNDTSVTGTFSGTALDSANRVVIVKEGKFSYRKRATVVPTASAGALGSASDSSCTGATVSGTYRKNTAVTSNNLVTLSANVTTAGTYTIYSDTIKGLYFRGTGRFSSAGLQNITVPAVGTPTDSGTVRFHIRYLNSVCTFTVRIDTASGVTVIPPTGDYFPTEAGRNWYYEDYNQTGLFDSGYIRSTALTTSFRGDVYTRFVSEKQGPVRDSVTYNRKNAGIYYTLRNLNPFGIPDSVSLTFLNVNTNAGVGSRWTDSITVTGGGTAFKAVSTVTAKNATAAVTTRYGTLSSTDVIKIETDISFSLPVPGTLKLERWYANGAGLIYSKQTSSAAPGVVIESKLSRYN